MIGAMIALRFGISLCSIGLHPLRSLLVGPVGVMPIQRRRWLLGPHRL
jgi:hypothetical protein